MKLSHLVVFVSGLLFSLGLGVAGMTQPAKIIGFLDFTGDWDASLAMVMVGAIGVHLVCYRLIRRRRAPLLSPVFAVPSSDRLDWRLVAGAALFGVGWGLSGYCPGPAFTSMGTGGSVLALVAGMLGGMGIHQWWNHGRVPRAAPEPSREAAAPPLEATQGS